MNKIEKVFDINVVLLTIFSSLKTLNSKKNIELIYNMDSTIPKELRGDSERLQRLLTQVLTFVIENSDKKEIVLSLSAPEDFLYEENISFKIKETDIDKDKVLEFLETKLIKTLEILDGEIIYDRNIEIYINIPFYVNELGYRRHYRLHDVSMMNKKVLILCGNKKVIESIKKMFKYFHYGVDTGIEEFKKQGSDLAQYDILLLDDRCATEAFDQVIAKAQEEIPLKYVLLCDSDHGKNISSYLVSTHLIKPVTQERIFELIVSLFKNREIKTEEKKYLVDLEKVLKNQENSENINKFDHLKIDKNHLSDVIESQKALKEPILDKKTGIENTKKMDLSYTEELKDFVETFEGSDLYFRRIVNEKATQKIKEFCIDLKKQSKFIGAQSMFHFADVVSLIFVYNKLDLLPIYPGKYHKELEQLLKEIKTYLDS